MLSRQSVIIYFRNPKVIKEISKHGHLQYYHKKRKYAVLYVDQNDVEKVTEKLVKLRHVRKVEPSHLDYSMYTLDL